MAYNECHPFSRDHLPISAHRRTLLNKTNNYFIEHITIQKVRTIFMQYLNAMFLNSSNTFERINIIKFC